MIVIGVDVHKQSLTAVAVGELGRELSSWSGPLEAALLSWAPDGERLWALEDCRHVSRGLERLLLEAGEHLVRVPPRLTAPARRRGRSRGKSDAIDTLAIARAALQERNLDRPRAGEERLRDLKLLLDHRDDLVAERRRAQQRLRWHLHELDPSLRVPLGALDRGLWLDRLGRRLARREQTTQVRIARELLARCRSLTRSVLELERELQTRTQRIAPRLLELAGCGALSAAKLLCEIGPIERFASDAQLARDAGVAPLEASSGKRRRHRLDRGGNRQLNCALHRIAVTQGRVYPPARAYSSASRARARAAARRSAASKQHWPSGVRLRLGSLGCRVPSNTRWKSRSRCAASQG
jgi:transposase